MAWIPLPDDEESKELARLTKRYRDQDRATPSVIGIMKPSPQTMRAVVQMNSAVTFGGSVLGRRREELIASSVSAYNDCFY
jgi:hypothetical protein